MPATDAHAFVPLIFHGLYPLQFSIAREMTIGGLKHVREYNVCVNYLQAWFTCNFLGVVRTLTNKKYTVWRESFIGANFRINALMRFRINFRIFNFVRAYNNPVHWSRPFVIILCSDSIEDGIFLGESDGDEDTMSTKTFGLPLLAKNFKTS